MNVNTKHLIDELVREGGPVRRLDRPQVRFIWWILVSAFYFATATIFSGLRPDFNRALGRTGFLMQLAAILALTTLSALSSFMKSVPDQDRPGMKWIPIAALFSWLFTISPGFLTVGNVHMGIGFSCVRDIFLLALAPGIALFWMLKKAAPLEPGYAGALAVLTVASFGAGSVQCICANDDPLHVFLWHWLPVAIVATLGFAIGRAVLTKMEIAKPKQLS
jgi:hypothetical protein